MRTANSIKNVAVSIGLGVIAALIGFVTQKIFIDYLSIEYLGINSLFTSIITMLAVAELGLGSAIIYNLYKPLEQKDHVRIGALMNFYKAAYRWVALVVVLSGLIITPFLPQLTSNSELPVNLYLIFALFVGDAALSYLMSYKRSILYADQKNYIINLVRIGTLIGLNITQIAILIWAQNYYLFVIMKIVSTLVENLILNSIVNRRYEAVKSQYKVDKETRRDIIEKAKGLLYHKVGSFVVLGTDNILLSMFFGVKIVGLYSNYLLVITALNAMFSQVITALTASVGNLLLEGNVMKQESIFKKIYFANFWISTVAAVCFLALIDPFIAIWLGSGYTFSTDIVIALTVSLYLSMLRVPIQTFKTAAGVFYEDRLMPVAEAIINLASSLLFLHIFGVVGVFIDTICSTLFLHIYSYPKYTYSKLFSREWSGYWRMTTTSLIVATAIASVSTYIGGFTESLLPLAQLGVKLLAALVISNGFLFILYRNSGEYAYFIRLLNNIIRRAKV